MAKSSRVVVSSRAGGAPEKNPSLFTAAERQLLAASEASGLARATSTQIQSVLARARTLRDKWRDLLAKQSRVQKRVTPAVAQANARSRAKSELFDGAVKRVEAHLASLSSAAKGLLPAAGPAAGRARPTPTKKSRVAGHRASRASVRADLAAKTRHLNEPALKQPAARPAVAKKTAAEPAPVAAVATPSKKAAAVKPAARKVAKRPVVASPQAIRFDRAKQRSAKTAAKKARLTIEGRTTRLGGHVLASGKRAQARRDKRGR